MIIYLAGGESHWKLMLECGVRNQLYSFFHMRTMRGKAFTEMVQALQDEKDRRDEAGEPQLRLFLDSDSSAYVASKGKKPDSHTYFREYKECLARTKELWHCVSEVYLDDSSLFDLNQAHEWREELLSLHSQVLPVWHSGRWQTSWDSYCLDPRYPYIAFGAGLDVGTKDKLCHFARLAGKQVHAISETKLRTDMMCLQADSYSSALWLTAQRYGSIYVFHGNQLRLIDSKNKQERKLFKPYFQASGIDFAQVMADDPYALNKCSLTAWRNMAATLELQGVRNGKGIEAGNSATATERGRPADKDGERNGAASITSKSSVDQSTPKLPSEGVNRQDSVQGGSYTGAKRSFSLHRVHGESEMKTRWILDRKLGRLVPSLAPAAVDLCGVQCPNNDLFCDLYYKHAGNHEGDIGGQRQGFGVLDGGVLASSNSTNHQPVTEAKALAVPVVPVGPDLVTYPQDVEDDVNTLSANMPKTVCDNCAISGECKEYSPGAVCYFDDDFGKLPIRNLDANLAEREVLLKFDRTRLMRAIMAERVSGGGALDSRVSQAMDDYIRRKNDFVTLAHKRNTTAVTASLTARGKPGIFSQMFGAAMPTGLRQEGDTEIPLNEPEQANGDVEITMTVTKDVPKKKE